MATELLETVEGGEVGKEGEAKVEASRLYDFAGGIEPALHLAAASPRIAKPRSTSFSESPTIVICPILSPYAHSAFTYQCREARGTSKDFIAKFLAPSNPSSPNVELRICKTAA